MKSNFRLYSVSPRRGAVLLAGLIAAAALSACLQSAAPTQNEVSVAAATGVAPTITQQPVDPKAKVGDRWAMGVTATGTAPLAYRWQECDWDGHCVNIPNANGATYTRIAHSVDSTILYRCVVSNAYGSAYSVKLLAWPRPLGFPGETAILTGGVVGNAGTGWYGTGYAAFVHQNGDNIVVKPTLSNSGTYTIRLRYAKTEPTASMRFELNGVVVNPGLTLWGGFSWDSYKFAQFDAHFNAGANTLKGTTQGFGGPHIDEIEIL